jgi:hypothetical protein
LDTDVGKDITRGVEVASKDGNKSWLVFPDPRGTTASFVGFVLGVITSWAIRMMVRGSDKTASASPAKDDLGKFLLADLAQTLFLAFLSAGGGLLALTQTDAMSRPVRVALVAALAGVIFGIYGAAVGWSIAEPTVQRTEGPRPNGGVQAAGRAAAGSDQGSAPQGRPGN